MQGAGAHMGTNSYERSRRQSEGPRHSRVTHLPQTGYSAVSQGLPQSSMSGLYVTAQSHTDGTLLGLCTCVCISRLCEHLEHAMVKAWYVELLVDARSHLSHESSYAQ